MKQSGSAGGKLPAVASVYLRFFNADVPAALSALSVVLLVADMLPRKKGAALKMCPPNANKKRRRQEISPAGARLAVPFS